jgi:hypothetical protein
MLSVNEGSVAGTGSIWTPENGMAGHRLGSRSNMIFIYAAGLMNPMTTLTAGARLNCLNHDSQD